MTIRRDIFKVDMSGDLSVRRATEIKSVLISVLREHPVVELDCTNATEVDLTFIQLALAAKKSADSSGVYLSLTHLDGGVLQTTLHRAGLVGSSVPISEADRTFWSSSAQEPTDGQDDPHSR